MPGRVRLRRHAENLDLYLEHVDMLQTAARVFYDDMAEVGQNLCVPSG